MRFKTKRIGGYGGFLVLIVVFFLGLQGSYATEQTFEILPPTAQLPVAELPLVVTTCGQSPGALMIRMVCGSIGLQCEEADLLTAKDLKSKAEEGQAYKTLIITTGTSLKGMGAAGIDIDYEVSRIKAVIQEAKKEGILIIGAHIEGMKRRVDETDYASIGTVIPESNLIIVRADGNEDGYFTKLAKEHNIPLITVKETLHLANVFKKLFQTGEKASTSS